MHRIRSVQPLRHLLVTRGRHHGVDSCDQFIHCADNSHGQPLRASAHVYLAHRKPAYFFASGNGNDVGYNKLTATILG